MHAHDHGARGRAGRRARRPPPDEPVRRGVEEVLELQRSLGNEATSGLVGPGREGGPGRDGGVRRSDLDGVLGGSGQSLPADVRAEVHDRTGVDLTGVRVHTDAAAASSARDMGARAYTTGKDMVFTPDSFDWPTLFHEAKHVEQQEDGPVAGADRGDGVHLSDPSDPFEVEAEATAVEASRGPAPARAAPALGEPAHGESARGESAHRRHTGHDLSLQRATAKDVQQGLSEADLATINDRLLTAETLIVPVPLPTEPTTTTRGQARNQARAMDQRLMDLGGGQGMAEITWAQLLSGEYVRMAYDSRDAIVAPHTGGPLGAAVTAALELRRDPAIRDDPVLGPFTEALVEWVMRRRSSSGGDLVVTVEATSSGVGSGARVRAAGRPGWNTEANQVVTGYGEDRRHIIAWHTMRAAFENAFNEALADGENVRSRIRELQRVLDRAETWAALDAEEESRNGSQEGSQDGDRVMGEAPPATASTSEDAMDLDTPPLRTSTSPPGGSPARRAPSPGNSSGTGSTTSEQLRTNLGETLSRVLGLLSNNPFNLWAGDSTENQSINRVGQQLQGLLDAVPDDDEELLARVTARARQAAGVRNEDQNVWTQVRDMVDGARASEVRATIRSIIDTTDVDLPVSGADEISSTYNSLEDQVAVVRNVLATGLAQEAVTMAGGRVPEGFDAVVDRMNRWLRRFLRPADLRTGMEGGHRVVGRRDG